MESRPTIITITPGTVVMVVFVCIGFLTAYYLRDLLLIVLTAVVLASAIEPPTAWLVRIGFPRVLAVVLLYLTGFVAVLSLFYFFVPRVIEETSSLVSALPTYLETLNIPSSATLVDVAGNNRSVVDQLLQFRDELSASSASIWNAATDIFGSIFSFVLILVLSFYLAVQEQSLDGFLRLIFPVHRHEYILDLWRRAQKKIGRWLQGQLLLSLIVGVFVAIGLFVLDVPYALLLAIAAAVLELIPVFGSIIAAIPAVAVAFVDAGTVHALLVIALYVIVNQVQGNIIYPWVVQKVLGISPLVVILSIIAGAKLGEFLGSWFLGILIAVPIAAAIQEYFNDVEKGKHRLLYPSDDGTIAP